MKAFIALVCLVAVVVAASTEEEFPYNRITCSIPDGDNDDWSVLIPNPEDCGSYYACNGLIPIKMFCPDGLHFNNAIKVCDWPENAKCVVH